MIAICTVCRRENGVYCPTCGHLATEVSPEIRNRPHGPLIAALYACARKACGNHRNPFPKQAGGITHQRHRSCPPTNRLEHEQTPPEGDQGDQP